MVYGLSVMTGKAKIAFWSGTIIGLVGVFGVGHLYLGRRNRGLAFLAWTGILAILVVAGLFVPQLWQTPANPTIVFGLGWVVQTYDLYRMVKSTPAVPVDRTVSQESR